MSDTATTTTTSEARIAELEEKLQDLANFVGRVTAGIFGDNFHKKYDCKMDELLVWKEETSDPGTEDEFTFRWWQYDSGEEEPENAG